MGRYPPQFPEAFYGPRFYTPNFIPEGPPEGNGEGMKEAVLKQAEYYFSVDNLCKDIYLRAKMDSEGYVPLGLVASFNKIRFLVRDRSALVEALRTSSIIEFSSEKQGLRRRNDWAQWLLSADGTGDSNVKLEEPVQEQEKGEAKNPSDEKENDEKTAKGEAAGVNQLVITQSVKTKYEKEKEEKDREKEREREEREAVFSPHNSEGHTCRKSLQEDLTSTINEYQRPPSGAVAPRGGVWGKGKLI